MAQTPRPASDPQPLPGPKLGRIELAILQKLRGQEGLTHREEALNAAYPTLGPRPAGTGTLTRAWAERRARAEAATTRAIQSLERKGLVVRERNERTGRSLLRSPDVRGLPAWEELARAEEDLAAHCRRRAEEWRELAGRASRRAERIRADREEGGTEQERVADLAEVGRLESGQRR